ncbi:uncharacterized protein E5676_scaffold701G00640 [Cucumis melo var. makuwa]|uniref:Uncharacterized protein n=1 Tax=Cucumis melo var. makuwa TaxID=1194695 RepID=A0A5A7ULU7_CUCMM|nr:uncharacterized protein E6C27_scaffold486G001150 [Cucumis melo var. makuwa]TYJ99933.1 uncharacterized protein E5676_scaffold701G00640 [Cucumis melo var. makuwa]
MMSPSSSGLPPLCPKQFKMIPSRCPLKRLHRLRDIHDGSSSSVQATSLEYSESFYDEFVDSTGRSRRSAIVPSLTILGNVPLPSNIPSIEDPPTVPYSIASFIDPPYVSTTILNTILPLVWRPSLDSPFFYCSPPPAACTSLASISNKSEVAWGTTFVVSATSVPRVPHYPPAKGQKLHSSILTEVDVVGLAPKLFSLTSSFRGPTYCLMNWSLSFSIEDLQGVVSGLITRRAAIDYVMHALHSLINDAQEKPFDSSGPIRSLFVNLQEEVIVG